MTTTYKIDCLALAPHPDDAEMWCGGTLSLLQDRGHTCGIVDLTQGELSTRGTLTQREQETKNATEILRLSRRENLRLPDGGLNSRDESQVKAVVGILRDLRPELLLVPFWEDRHPDHREASALVDRALFLSGLSKYETGKDSTARYTARQIAYYPMRHVAHPSFIVDVSSVHARKMQAVRAYETQFGIQQKHDSHSAKTELSTLLSSPLSLSSLDARDQFFGAMIGVQYAEPFVLRTAMRIQDPLEHFRNASVENALFFPLP